MLFPTRFTDICFSNCPLSSKASEKNPKITLQCIGDCFGRLPVLWDAETLRFIVPAARQGCNMDVTAKREAFECKEIFSDSAQAKKRGTVDGKC